jgi:hypothetical protein
MKYRIKSFFLIVNLQTLIISGLLSGECSITNQYLQKMMIAFESIKHIYKLRTPRALCPFSALFIKVLPIVYVPYFTFKTELNVMRA